MPQNPFDKLLARMEETGVATAEELRGCTATEIGRLERKYHVTLPATYRRFLEVMGHKSARLFSHDHVNTDFAHVIKDTAILRKQLKEEGLVDVLPADALVIISRDAEQYNFIRCDSPDDSMVWALDLGALRIRPKKFRSSVIGWMSAWAKEAAEAVADGWYD